LDLFSRKTVGTEVHERDDSEHAVHLVRRTALAEGIAAWDSKPVLHGDNGSTLKATTVLTMLNWLGVKPSYSRPRVSNDNAFSEALFRKAKYRPEFPVRALSRWNKRASGPLSSCIGTTSITATAVFAMSAQSNATAAKIKPSLPRAMRCTPKLRLVIRHAGQVPHETGL
jgi:transposase InsO family protein